MMCLSNVLDRAQEALDSSPISTLRDLRVEATTDSLIISGKVSSFYEKQMAQEAIRAVCKDIQLQNTVDVS